MIESIIWIMETLFLFNPPSQGILFFSRNLSINGAQPFGWQLEQCGMDVVPREVEKVDS